MSQLAEKMGKERTAITATIRSRNLSRLENILLYIEKERPEGLKTMDFNLPPEEFEKKLQELGY